MNPLPPSYLARKLLNAEIPWPLPHRDQPGFVRLDAAARLENLLPVILPATLDGEPAASLFLELARTLKTLKTSERIDRRILSRMAAELPPLIERARDREEQLHQAADPDHPMMTLLKQDGPMYFQAKDAIARYHAAQGRRIALETLHDGLDAIDRAMARRPPSAAQGR